MSNPAASGFSKAHRQFLAISMVLAVLAAGGGAIFLRETQQQAMQQQAEDLRQIAASYHYEYKNAVGSYLSGRLAASKGDVKSALKHMSETMTYQQSDRVLLVQAYRLSVLAGDFDQAGAYLEKLSAKSDDRLLNPNLLRVVLAVKNGDFVKAHSKLKAINPKGASSLFLPVLDGWIRLGLHEPLDIKKLENAIRVSGQFKPLLYYQVALLLDAAGMKEEAKSHYDTVLKREELSYRIALALANFYARQGEKQNVTSLQQRYERQFNRSLGEIPKQPLVASAREGTAEIFYGISSLLFGLEAYEEAQIPLQLALYLRPDFDAVFFLQGNLLERQEQYTEAYEVYEKLKDHPAFWMQASIRMAYCLHESGKTKQALALLSELHKRNPEEIEPVLTMADILRVKKRYPEAVEKYNQALSLIRERQPKHWPLLYARGISYERIGEWEKAEKDFLEALRLQPDQPDVLNYLGYSWIVKNKHVVQAKEMIEKAMTERPQDAYIIDSMGWAMYALGNYDEALEYLEQAVELAPRDPTVNEHLGDVYWRKGYKLQARYQWERALFFEPEEPGQEQALRNKLSEGLPALTEKKPEMVSQNIAMPPAGDLTQVK